LFESRTRTLATERMLGAGEMELFAEGRAPSVVAIHGFGGTVAELRPLLDRVVDAGYAVDGALLPGHGSSVTKLQDTTFDDWVEATRVRARSAAREHGSVVLLGFSLGSLVAMQIASERPAWLSGLVVLGNAVTLQPHSSVPLALLARSGAHVPDVYLLKPRAGDLVDPAMMDRLVSYDRHPLRASLEVYLAGPRVRAGVGLIDCPTLILRPGLPVDQRALACRPHRHAGRQRARLRTERARPRLRRRTRRGRPRGAHVSRKVTDRSPPLRALRLCGFSLFGCRYSWPVEP
jgi:esterase/lipase